MTDSIEAKIGQLLFIGIPGAEFDATTEKLIAEIRPGGVCFFARNIKTAEQTRDLTDAIRDRSAIQPLISIDQEGGTVDRLKRILTPMPAAASIRTADDARTLGEITGDALSLLGFNMNFAPVLDVIDNARERTDNGLYSRAFGRSADEVVVLAGAYARGLHQKGIFTCGKHFPGLGAAAVDSHAKLPAVSLDMNGLDSVDLIPYKALIPSGALDAVMVAHAAFPETDLQEADVNGKLLPSSLSGNFVGGLLREKLAFAGPVITDDLEMGAIVNEYGVGEAAVMAILAGNDMAAICAGVDSIYEAFEALKKALADGRLSEERLGASVDRIAAVKQRSLRFPNFSSEAFQKLSEDMSQFRKKIC
jgi:beta-N-acetylhexosaminidase